MGERETADTAASSGTVQARAPGALIALLDEYATSCNMNRSQALRVILETFLGNDPRWSRERTACKAAIREGLLVGYAAGKAELEQALGRGLNQVEILERSVYRSLYRDGEIKDHHRNARVMHDLERRGDLDKIDEEKRKAATPRAKPRRLTAEERDAQELGLAAPGRAPENPTEQILDAVEDAVGLNEDEDR